MADQQLALFPLGGPFGEHGFPIDELAQERAVARATDPDSSHAAAVRCEQRRKAHSQRSRILVSLLQFDGATGYELAARLNFSQVRVLRRLGDLQRTAYVRRTRDGEPVAPCAVNPDSHQHRYYLTDLGRRAALEIRS